MQFDNGTPKWMKQTLIESDYNVTGTLKRRVAAVVI